MKLYDRYTPIEEETYDEYKQRKNSNVEKLIEKLKLEVYQSSLKVPDQIILINKAKNSL